MRFSDEWLNKILDLLEKQLGPNCEIVLQRLEKDRPGEIEDIRNGHITGRRKGERESSLGLEVQPGAAKGEDRFNYITYTRDNRILRSSAICLEGGEDGAKLLTINMDITDSIRCQEYLRQFNHFALEKEESDKQTPEIPVNHVQDLLERLIGEARQLLGRTPERMSREDKMRFIAYLDQRGAFLVTRSGDKVCDYLDISKYTLYRYLEIIRGDSKEAAE